MGAVRSLTIAIAWLAATAAAVGVSWLGVRTVVDDAVLPQRIAVPTSPVSTGMPPPTPVVTSVSPTPPSTVRPSGTPMRTTTTAPTTTTTVTTQSSSDTQRYAVPGGVVVLDLSPTRATLVSATPANGYSVQVWQETGWLRVDFSSGNGTSTVFATWNGHPPAVQTYQS